VEKFVVELGGRPQVWALSQSVQRISVLQTAHSSYDHIEQGRALKGTMFSDMWDTTLQYRC
jgi:hypothetical protein